MIGPHSTHGTRRFAARAQTARVDDPCLVLTTMRHPSLAAPTKSLMLVLRRVINMATFWLLAQSPWLTTYHRQV